MKRKIFAITISVILSFALIFSYGCGNVFSGKYKKITVEELLSFTSAVEENAGRYLDFSKGFTVLGKYDELINGSQNLKEIDSKIIFKNGGLVSTGTTLDRNSYSNVTKEIYYENGIFYNQITENGKVILTKTEGDISAFTQGYLFVRTKLSDWYEELKNFESLEIKKCVKDGDTKISLFVEEKNAGIYGITGSFYVSVIYVYDANSYIKGINVQVSVSGVDGSEKTASILAGVTIEPFNADVTKPDKFNNL